MNTRKKYHKRLAGICISALVAITFTLTVEAQDRTTQQREQGSLKTLDEMPDTAAKFTLNNGREMYFLDGELYTFADRNSAFVVVPMDRIAARMNVVRKNTTRRWYAQKRFVQKRYTQKRFASKRHAQKRYAKKRYTSGRFASKRNIKKRHAQWHKKHRLCFHQG